MTVSTTSPLGAMTITYRSATKDCSLMNAVGRLHHLAPVGKSANDTPSTESLGPHAHLTTGQNDRKDSITERLQDYQEIVWPVLNKLKPNRIWGVLAQFEQYARFLTHGSHNRVEFGPVHRTGISAFIYLLCCEFGLQVVSMKLEYIHPWFFFRVSRFQSTERLLPGPGLLERRVY